MCPGCERGCSVNIWHRKAEWHLRALDPKQNTSIARVTPLENPAVNGPWICNKGRDLAQIFERPRADHAMQKGKPVELAAAIVAARKLIGEAKHPVALVSSWGSNEELAAFQRGAGRALRDVRQARPCAATGRAARGRPPHPPRQESEHRRRARAVRRVEPARAGLPGRTRTSCWCGAKAATSRALPAGAKIIFLNSYLQPENGHADVFIPVSIQTERAGHYTNFAGVVTGFERCFAKKATVADAQELFAALAPGAAGKP